MRKALFLLLIALLLGPQAPALAQGRAREHVRSGDVQPLDRILPQIRRNHPGSFYDAEGPYPDQRGGYRYRLKWLTPEGRVIWLDTDARTGRVLGTNRGRAHLGDERAVRPRDRISGEEFRGRREDRRERRLEREGPRSDFVGRPGRAGREGGFERRHRHENRGRGERPRGPRGHGGHRGRNH